jgi:hypothetical protein
MAGQRDAQKTAPTCDYHPLRLRCIHDERFQGDDYESTVGQADS